MDPVAAWYVGNVLLGTPPPENAAGGRIAFKTGTSYGYRDAWAVGFDGTAHDRRLGRPARRRAGAGPGRPRRRGADPVRCLRPHRQAADAAAARAPKGALIAATAKLPPPLQRFRPGRLPGEGPSRNCASCSRRTARGSSCKRRRRQAEPIALKVAGGSGPLTVLVNGLPLAAAPAAARCSSSPKARVSCASP